MTDSFSDFAHQTSTSIDEKLCKDAPSVFNTEPGTAVPTVDPEDMKAAWRAYKQIEASNPKPGTRIGIGTGVFRRECKPGADVRAVSYRLMMMDLILRCSREELSQWTTTSGEPTESMFRAFALVPMTWIPTGVEVSCPFDQNELERLLLGEARSKPR